MDERIYVETFVPYGELTRGVDNPRGERLAPGSLRHAPGHPPRLFLAHGGDRARYRIPAGRMHEAGQEPGGLHLVWELHRTEEGRRAAENALDSCPHVSPEFICLHDHVGGLGERVVDAAILHAVALCADPAYQGARVVAVQTATERRAARFAAVAAALERARQDTPAPPDVAALLAITYDPAIAGQHTSAESMALLSHRYATGRR